MWVADKNFYEEQSVLTPSSNASFGQINNHYLLNQLHQRRSVLFSSFFDRLIQDCLICVCRYVGLFLLIWQRSELSLQVLFIPGFHFHVQQLKSFTKIVTFLVSWRPVSQQNDKLFSWSMIQIVCRHIFRTVDKYKVMLV